METLLNQLLQNEEKSITTNERFIVKNIEMMNEIDLIQLDLQQNDKLYQGLVMIKGSIFPIPKIYDVLLVEKIYLKYSEDFELKLYIEGKIVKEKLITLEATKTYSFENSNIFNIIPEFKEIKSINSSIFRIINKNESKMIIKCLSDSNNFQLRVKTKKLIALKENDFLWINFYELKGNKILLNKFSTLEVLNEGRLLHILESIDFKKVKLFHIIDINDDNFKLINSNGKMFELNKNKNKIFIENYKMNFCMTIILSNYKVKKQNEIELNEYSFIYIFKEQSYYIENILVNSYAVIELNFLDFKEINNIFDHVLGKQTYFILENGGKIKEEESKNELSLKISKKIQYIIISCKTSKKYEYFPFDLTLYNSQKEKEISVTFTIYLYVGLINKINVFINTNCSKRYFYEFLYYNINNNLGKVEKNIIIDGKNYNIDISDNFGSENRKRICIMNIPYQEMEVDDKEFKNNSIQICELRKGNIHKILGIYDISYENFDEEEMNDYFDKYYSDFGDVYDLMKKYDENNLDKVVDILKEKIEKFKSYNFAYDFSNITIFNNSMTLSQFKTRAGLIICQFMSKYKNDYTIEFIREISNLYNQINNENLDYSEILRILVYILRENIINDKLSNIELRLISKFNIKSPYYIAYEFNKKQINCLNEFSPLFEAYLQLDSYKSYNYIHQMESHTFSMELNFMMKYQLLSTYEKFFFVKKEMSEEYALLDDDTYVTVINQLTIFGKDFKEKDVIEGKKSPNDYAMPLSINFTHEKSGHFKYSLKNHYPNSPLIYFKGLKTKIVIQYVEDHFIGESGLIMHNYICDDENVIYELLTNFIYGYLLNEKYFCGNDFEDLIKEVKEKSEKNKSNSPSSKKSSSINKYNKSKLSPKIHKFKKYRDIKFNPKKFEKYFQTTKEEKRAKLLRIWEHREKIIIKKKQKLEKFSQE